MNKDFRDTILYETGWLSLRMIQGSGLEYVYSHEKRCNGKKVGFLPYKKDKSTGTYRFLVRHELVPPWGLDTLHMVSFTGGVENDLILKTLHQEIYEEIGVEVGKDIHESKIEPIFVTYTSLRATKSTDTKYYLFYVDLTEVDQYKVKFDNTGTDEIEKRAKNEWVIGPDVFKSKDPMLLLMFVNFYFTRVKGGKY
jgi:8-oxo-dGTP pyrophosphatase MutT (NUDIX family)